MFHRLPPNNPIHISDPGFLINKLVWKMNSHLFQPSTVTVTFFAVSATATEHIICIISHVHGCEVEERELITLIFALRHENTEVFASFN